MSQMVQGACLTMDSLIPAQPADTYVKVGIHGCEREQSSDIHWRAKKGKASWNYRLKFDVELGLKTQSYKFPYLKMQMWDKDILKYDDLIAETVLDIGEFFKKAFRFSMDEEKKHKVFKVCHEQRPWQA